MLVKFETDRGRVVYVNPARVMFVQQAEDSRGMLIGHVQLVFDVSAQGIASIVVKGAERDVVAALSGAKEGA